MSSQERSGVGVGEALAVDVGAGVPDTLGVARPDTLALAPEGRTLGVAPEPVGAGLVAPVTLPMRSRSAS